MARPAVTILQLDTAFARIPGDVASPDSYLGELEVLRIPGASVGQIVHAHPERIDITPFAKSLRGAQGDVIATSCGFLAPWQDVLQAETDRPVIASSLSLIPELAKTIPAQALCVVTFDTERLGPAHLPGFAEYLAGGIGLRPKDHLRRVIEGDMPTLDAVRAEAELIALMSEEMPPKTQAILLECTNLPPYAAALRRHLDLPVHDILTAIEAVAPGSVQPRFLPVKP